MEQVKRRELLIAAAAGSLVSLATNANAQGQSLGDLSDLANLVASKVKAPSPTTPVRELERWGSLKERMNAVGIWPKAFDTSFEEGVFDEITKIHSEEKNGFSHNPRLVEPLLGEVASLLDRCIAYRREGSELELAGVAAGANRLVSDSLREIDQRLTRIDVAAEFASTLVKTYPKAVEAYSKVADLGQANALELGAQVSAHRQLSSKVEERIKLLLGRLEFTQDVDRQLLSRHDVPGNADNFVERYERLRKLFSSDITSAYRRAIAAAAGLSSIFAVALPLPAITKNGLLDDLVIWTRQAMRAVSRACEAEIEFVRIQSLPVPSTGTITANFDTAFSGFKSVRLRSVSAYYCLKGGDVANNNEGNASIGLSMVKSSPSIGPRIVFVLPSIRQFSAQRDSFDTGGALPYNVDPLGSWSIRLSSTGISGNGTPFERKALIERIVIEMKVVAIPDLSLDGTWWISQEDRV